MGYINKRGKPELVVDRALLRGGTSFRRVDDNADTKPTSNTEGHDADEETSDRRDQ